MALIVLLKPRSPADVCGPLKQRVYSDYIELCNIGSIFLINSPYDFSYELRLVLTESQWLNESNSSDCSQQQYSAVLTFFHRSNEFCSSDFFFTKAMSPAVLISFHRSNELCSSDFFHRSNEFCSSDFVSQKQ